MALTFRLQPSTLTPPALTADDDAAAAAGEQPWALLELYAYVAKRENGTTARSNTWDGKEIQVTLCPRRPPNVSYLCVHSPDAAEIRVEPQILAMEDDLVLLRITVGSVIREKSNIDYYIYQPGRPSLDRLPRPPSPSSFNARDIGVLRYSADDDDTQDMIFLRPHRPKTQEYIVAGLYYATYGQPLDEFYLCLYDSKQGGDWKTYTVSLNHQQQQKYGDHFHHNNCKVMAIGGEAATMAFVDLWRGILFCDMRRVEEQAARQADGQPVALLRYVQLPQPLQENKALRGDAGLYRNIALVNGFLKYVELQLRWKASVVFRDQYLADGWMAAIWSRPATSDNHTAWHKDCETIDSNDLVDVHTNPHFKLLPKGPSDEGILVPPFKRLHVSQPVLGLQDGEDDILYFTTNLGPFDDTISVTAVDLRKKVLVGVARFSGARTLGMGFKYIHSRITRYLNKEGHVSHMVPLPTASSKSDSGMEGKRRKMEID